MQNLDTVEVCNVQCTALFCPEKLLEDAEMRKEMVLQAYVPPSQCTPNAAAWSLKTDLKSSELFLEMLSLAYPAFLIYYPIVLFLEPKSMFVSSTVSYCSISLLLLTNTTLTLGNEKRKASKRKWVKNDKTS